MAVSGGSLLSYEVLKRIVLSLRGKDRRWIRSPLSIDSESQVLKRFKSSAIVNEKDCNIPLGRVVLFKFSQITSSLGRS
jgi:hypothetical protein